MGICFEAAGLDYKDSYDCGYATFALYRRELAKAIDPMAGEIYASWMSSTPGYSDENGIQHDDGCTMMLDFSEYDRKISSQIDAAPDRKARKEAREKGRELYERRCEELSSQPFSGFSLEPGIRGIAPTRIRFWAKYDDLDNIFKRAFPPTTAGFLFMPDTDGKLSWKECRDLYKELENVKVDAKGHNYGECKTVKDGNGKPLVDIRSYNMHEQFLGMFKHCWKRHVNLWWR